MTIKNTQIESANITEIFSATGQQAITTMIFCNTDPSTDATVDVFVVPDGSNPGQATQTMKALSLPATETFVLDTERLILEDGDTIHAQSSVDAIVTVTVSSLATS